MKVPGTILVCLLTLATLSACSTVDVATDYDHSAVFGTYRTYSLAPGPDGRELPMYCDMALRKVIRSQLAARGITESTGPDADLAIVWRVFLTDKTSAREIADARGGDRWDYAYGTYSSWMVAPTNFSNTSRYPDGTLILDVVDMRTKKLVFRGTGTAVAMGPERGARNIEKAVTKMVAALPGKR